MDLNFKHLLIITFCRKPADWKESYAQIQENCGTRKRAASTPCRSLQVQQPDLELFENPLVTEGPAKKCIVGVGYIPVTSRGTWLCTLSDADAPYAFNSKLEGQNHRNSGEDSKLETEATSLNNNINFGDFHNAAQEHGEGT